MSNVYVYGADPPAANALNDIDCPASIVFGATGVVDSVTVNAELTVIIPESIELAVASALSVTRTFAWKVLPIMNMLAVKVNEFDPDVWLAITVFVIELNTRNE